MKKIVGVLLAIITVPAFASNMIPVGDENNKLYYKIGGGSDFALPPVSETERITLDTNTNLSMGQSCGAYNPALSIVNSMNNLKNSTDNIAKDVLANATGSILMLPGYEFAKRNPTLYAFFNNYLQSAHNELAVTTKSCQVVKEQISSGQNPYQDWGTIAVNDQWKQKLSLAAENKADINTAKKDIDFHQGENGVAWVNGKNESDGSVRAGGKGQPPVHVITDTVKAGYNTILNRDLKNESSPAKTTTNTELITYFSSPTLAATWVTNVVGDQIITTCSDEECKKKQGSVVGHGLLAWANSCHLDNENCVESIQDHLAKLVTGNSTVNKENLEKVSAGGIAMSPEVIASIRIMDKSQQQIIIHKLSQEIAAQRVIDKALVARRLLATGAQVPVISANHPAQVVIGQAITNLDNDIRSITFESQIRKQMMSDTLTQVLNYSNSQQRQAMSIGAVSAPQTVMENGALPTLKEKK